MNTASVQMIQGVLEDSSLAFMGGMQVSTQSWHGEGQEFRHPLIPSKSKRVVQGREGPIVIVIIITLSCHLQINSSCIQKLKKAFIL